MATRDYQFINGPETSTLPTVTEPSTDSDLINKGFADKTYTRGVADVATLKAIGSSARTDNQTVWVDALQSFFFFDSSSSATGDDVHVITPTAGTGRWLRIYYKDGVFRVVDSSDITKYIDFDPAGTTGTKTTVATSQTANRVFTLPDITGTALTEAGTQNITNKGIDADLNTITNIENADIKAGAGIARNKLASGSNSHVLINDGSGVMTSEAQLDPARGGTGQATLEAAFNALSPMTTKGDLISRNGTTRARLAVGTNGQVLTADSAEATGLKWSTLGTAQTAGGVVFGTGAGITTDSAKFFFDDTNDRLGLGTATPGAILHVRGQTSDGAIAHDQLATPASHAFTRYNTSFTSGSYSAIGSAEIIGRLSFNGTKTTSATGEGARFEAVAAENWTNTALGTHLTFTNTPTGSTSLAERVRITSQGEVSVLAKTGSINTTPTGPVLSLQKETGGPSAISAYGASGTHSLSLYASDAGTARETIRLTGTGGALWGSKTTLSTSGPVTSGKAVTLAAGAIADLSTNGFNGVIFVITSGANFGMFMLQGGAGAVQELLDPSSQFGTTVSAGANNVYWSAGSARYILQNNTAGSLTYTIFGIQMGLNHSTLE
jgi:hypothetical protein